MTTTREALESALNALDGLATGSGLINPIEQTIAQLKAALAELEKCEPVAVVRWRNGEMFVKFKTNFIETNTNLYTSPPERERWVSVPFDLLDSFPEINMSNYGDDEVRNLNNWGIELVNSAAPKENSEPVLFAVDDYLNCAKRYKGQTLCAIERTDLHSIPLYTSPPKREWVGLSEAQQTEIINDTVSWQGGCNPQRIARTLEAKLKELNT